MKPCNQNFQPRSESNNASITVAPCFNAEKYIADLLEALMQQTVKPDEIVLVDDGSTDSTVNIAKAYCVNLIEHGMNKGLACARNTALKIARGDIIVYLDADTIPEKRNLERIKRGYTGKDIAGVGGQEFFTSPEKQIDLWRNLFWRQTHGDKRNQSTWMLMGLVSSYRKMILRKIGGFNENYKTHGEDVDIGLRLRKAGYRLVYLPEIGVYHRRSDSMRSLVSLVYQHSFWQSRAIRTNGINPSFQTIKAFKWLFVCIGSSVYKHRHPVLALISSICCMSAICGRIVELMSAKKVRA
jgi:GT2 family glycosyltransferase